MRTDLRRALRQSEDCSAGSSILNWPPKRSRNFSARSSERSLVRTCFVSPPLLWALTKCDLSRPCRLPSMGRQRLLESIRHSDLVWSVYEDSSWDRATHSLVWTSEWESAGGVGVRILTRKSTSSQACQCKAKQLTSPKWPRGSPPQVLKQIQP